MTDDVTVTISAGRNIGATPMGARAWTQFRADIAQAIHDARGEIFVNDARSIGEWEGVREDSATFVASIPRDYLPHVRDALAYLARVNRQDAIALTVGATELVSAESTPAWIARLREDASAARA